MKTPLPRFDDYILNLSGLLAIALVGWISVRYHQALPNLLLHLLFAAAFTAESFANLLGVNRRQARAALLLMLVLTVIALAMNGDTVALILAVVLMASVPHHTSARESWLLLAAANLAYLAVFAVLGKLSGNYMFSWLTLFALQVFAITSSLAKRREIDTQETLQRSNNELLAARAVMAQQSQAEERLRIAGDLHDSVGHRLTALQLQLEVLTHEAPPALAPQVATCQNLARDLLEEVRTIVRRMSQERSDDLATAVGELDALTPGVSVSLRGAMPSMTPELARQLVFCFQEAIHNAIRHGGASRVEIAFRGEAFHVVDNGRGLRSGQVAEGFGLRNIKKRLAPFNGSASLAAGTAGGCELTIALAGVNSA